jgi:hypothetical protein
MRKWLFGLQIVLILLAGTEVVPHQMQRTWSPPDKRFSVVVPVKLHEIKREFEDQSQDLFSSIRLFGSSEADASNGAFEVIVLQLSGGNKLRGEQKLKGLEVLIGGEDQAPTSVMSRQVAGLAAKEVRFVGPTKCNKGLIIDGGDRIYVLAVSVTSCQQLNSAGAERFFESFRLRHK